MTYHRRSFLKAGFLYLTQRNFKRERLVFYPEQYGAKGDGLAKDGLAISKLIDDVNSTQGDTPIEIVFRGDYSLAGCLSIEYAPSARYNRGGEVRGLPALRRNNVSIDARGSTFVVPKFINWRRIKRGGSSDDIFFVGFQLYGNSSSFTGGRISGNLSNRNVQRGPKVSGFGGNEFGLVLAGKNWKLSGTRLDEWGTDCLLIRSSGVIKDCHFSYGRRNNISIVPGSDDCDVHIENSVFLNAGNWSEDIRNRPGAGIQVESGRDGKRTTLFASGNTFENNKEKDIQLSKGSYRCELVGNTFTNQVNIRPGSLGGHKIWKNQFKGGGRMGSIYGGENDELIDVHQNSFELSFEQAIKVNKMKLQEKIGQLPNISFRENDYR